MSFWQCQWGRGSPRRFRTAPRLDSDQLFPQSAFALNLRGKRSHSIGGRVYKVDMSTNLLNWSTLKLLTNRTGDVCYVDPPTNSPEAPAGFFRITEQR